MCVLLSRTLVSHWFIHGMNAFKKYLLKMSFTNVCITQIAYPFTIADILVWIFFNRNRFSQLLPCMPPLAIAITLYIHTVIGTNIFLFVFVFQYYGSAMYMHIIIYIIIVSYVYGFIWRCNKRNGYISVLHLTYLNRVATFPFSKWKKKTPAKTVPK